jgi:hypothetical protein
MSNFKFGEAIEALKSGKKVSRIGWNGKGMFVFMRPEDILTQDFIINKVKSLPKFLKYLFQKNVDTAVDEKTKNYLLQGEVKFTSYLCMYAADGSIVNGWLASQTDMLAEDWEIIE